MANETSITQRETNMTLLPALALGTILNMQSDNSPEITVYNGGFALVKEQRVFQLKSGTQQVEVKDVAAMIEANSVAIKSLSAPGSFTVWEQNYQYDLISPEAILNKAVGQKITFNRILPNGATERLVGTLMSAPNAMVSDQNGGQSMTWNGMVIKTDDGRVILNPSGEIEVGSIPNGLISSPTLVWTLDASKAGANTVALSYITRGMSWNADYVMSLDKDGKIGDLKGWVTMANNSGTTYENAKLKLLAGTVFRAQPPGSLGRGGGEAKMMMDAMSEESFADYHLYTLPRPSSIRNKEIKQLNLLEANGVSVAKRLIADLNQWYGFRTQNSSSDSRTMNPVVMVEFKNEEKNKLGMALPMGNFKVYQPDSSGSLLLIGEARIDHTARNEMVSLAVGQAFDVIVQTTRTAYTAVKNGFDETLEIEVRNRKTVDQQVIVRVHHQPGTTVEFGELKGTKKDAMTWEFVVDCKPDEVKKFTYKTQYRTQ